jgi:hypothetical protein
MSKYKYKLKPVSEESTINSNSFFTSGGMGEDHNGRSPRKSTYGAYTQAGYEKVEEVNEGSISKEEAWKGFFEYHELGKQKPGIVDYAYKEFEKGWNKGYYKNGNYERISESNPGATMGPGPKAGPEGVTKNKYVTDFKYKLVDKKKLNKAAKGIEVKQLWEANTDVESYLKDIEVNNPDNKKFIASRILGFDEVETKLNELIPLLQQAKHKTMDYYRQNPSSFGVVYGTDLAKEYLDDLIELFKD